MRNTSDERQKEESKIIKVVGAVGKGLNTGLDLVSSVGCGATGSFWDLITGFDFGDIMTRGKSKSFKIGYYATELAIYTAAVYAMFTSPSFDM